MKKSLTWTKTLAYFGILLYAGHRQWCDVTFNPLLALLPFSAFCKETESLVGSNCNGQQDENSNLTDLKPLFFHQSQIPPPSSFFLQVTQRCCVLMLPLPVSETTCLALSLRLLIQSPGSRWWWVSQQQLRDVAGCCGFFFKLSPAAASYIQLSCLQTPFVDSQQCTHFKSHRGAVRRQIVRLWPCEHVCINAVWICVSAFLCPNNIKHLYSESLLSPLLWLL